MAKNIRVAENKVGYVSVVFGTFSCRGWDLFKNGQL